MHKESGWNQHLLEESGHPWILRTKTKKTPSVAPLCCGLKRTVFKPGVLMHSPEFVWG